MGGLLGDLWVIQKRWNESTAGKSPRREQAAPNTVAVLPFAEPSVSPAPAPAGPGSLAQTADDREADQPTERAVLIMVVLLGALGGFLHLASSMANYVGNRQLLRSWLVYYFLIPFQGAALAPVIYLLLRVGVLNPANPLPGSTDASTTEHLNLIGIYAFAALSGLFSKQAIEMMADVFSTIFKRVAAKDPLKKDSAATS